MVNYQQGKIYKLVDNTNGNIYIGSTCQNTLAKRLSDHVSNYKCYLNGKQHYITSYRILENGNYDIVLLESCPCETKDELYARERHYIESLKCVNKCIVGRTTEENKDYMKNYIETHKDVKRQYDKIYIEANKERINERCKQYREINKDKINEKQSVYRLANPQKKKDSDRKYRLENKETINEYKTAYRLANREKINENKRRYYQAKKEAMKLNNELN